MTKLHPYADYRIEVREDFSREVYYSQNGDRSRLIRVHYRVSRTPSEKLFVVRHLAGATPQDRRNALAKLDRIGTSFRSWERNTDCVSRGWDRRGNCWRFVAYSGTAVEDPLVQLELEMMIDLAQREPAEVRR